MASNLIINPNRAANADHIIDENQTPADYINKILSETDARMDLLLLEPTVNNLNDIRTKIANETAGSPKGALFSALATMYDNLYGSGPNCFRKKKNGRKLVNFKVMNTSMPFAIFGVEYSKDYKQFNHVKIDLYSAMLDNENNRRSFVIWQKEDPDNYLFFINNFDSVFNETNNLSRRAAEEDLKGWKDTWEAMDE